MLGQVHVVGTGAVDRPRHGLTLGKPDPDIGTITDQQPHRVDQAQSVHRRR
jgi:hypothetical protein